MAYIIVNTTFLFKDEKDFFAHLPWSEHYALMPVD